jgi:uncharacterized circularly permuted ATP-grasp superfamily protein
VFNGYDPGEFFDEMFDAPDRARSHYAPIFDRLNAMGRTEFERRRSISDLTFRNQGITFTVYGDSAGTERTFPFDPVPRIIPAHEWDVIERGLTQRVRALNLF